MKLKRKTKRRSKHGPCKKLGLDSECILLKWEVIALGKDLSRNPKDPVLRGRFMNKKKEFKKKVKAKNNQEG
jgi:hypothetical protein